MIRVFRRDTLLLSFASKQMHRGFAAFWVCLPFSPARRNKTYGTWCVLGLAMRATTHYTCMIPGVFTICTPINVSRYNKYLYYIFISYIYIIYDLAFIRKIQWSLHLRVQHDGCHQIKSVHYGVLAFHSNMGKITIVLRVLRHLLSKTKMQPQTLETPPAWIARDINPLHFL